MRVSYLDVHPEVAIVGCQVECFPRQAVAEGYARYEAWQNSLLSHNDMTREIFVESPIAHPSFMMRRQAIIDLGGYRDMGWRKEMCRRWKTDAALSASQWQDVWPRCSRWIIGLSCNGLPKCHWIMKQDRMDYDPTGWRLAALIFPIRPLWRRCL